MRKNSNSKIDKQCKPTEWFSVMPKQSEYFLSLDKKSKQKYKVTINNLQGYDPYETKKGRTIRWY